jgi:protein phosphatase
LLEKITIKSFAKSDVGLVRRNNEDVFALLPEEKFFILADGMGGHQGGEVAAQKAVDYMCGAIKTLLHLKEEKLHVEDISSKIQLFIESANYWVNYLGSKNPELKGMGTTLCSLLFHEKRVIFSHVGDSRIYLLREKSLKPLTVDHCVHSDPLCKRSVKEIYDQVSYYSKKVLTRVVGSSREVLPDISHEEIRLGDVYLLCSDGLSDLLSDEEIKMIIEEDKSLSEKGNLLIEKAKSRGGHDNITLVLVEVE